MKKYTRFWCWWLSRYIYFINVNKKGNYCFIDICDVQFELTEKEFRELERA